MGLFKKHQVSESEAIDIITDNLIKRTICCANLADDIRKSDISGLTSESKTTLTCEFHLLRFHLVDRLAFTQGLNENMRLKVSNGILTRLRAKGLLLATIEELNERDIYYSPCIDLFPKSPSEPGSLIGKLMLKVEQQGGTLNSIDEMLLSKGLADLVINKAFTDAEIQACIALKAGQLPNK